MKKEIKTPKKEKRDLRNANIVKDYKSMQGSKTAIIDILSAKYDLTPNQIRNVLKTEKP